VKAELIETVINSILKPEYGISVETDNGILFGDRNRDITCIATCWSPTVSVLQQAVQAGAQAVFSHEVPFIPDGEAASELWKVPQYSTMPANVKRRKIYTEHNLVLYKYHYPLDGWPIWGMPRALAAALKFDLSTAQWVNRFLPVFNLEPQSLRAFAEHVRDCLGLSGIDIAGDLNRNVTRVALMVGGFATRFWISEFARAAGADVMIAGELLDYTARTAIEADIAVIKAGHYPTEEPAVVRFSSCLQEQLQGKVKVVHIQTGDSWNHYGSNET